MKKIIITALIVVFTLPAFAIDLLPQESPGFYGRKVRNLGMGNIGTSIPGTVDSAAFYNPAGLNDIEDSEWRFLTMTFEVTKSSFDLISDLTDLSDDLGNADTSADNVRVLNDFISARTGEFQRFRIGMEIFSYTRKNFAAGLLFDERLDLSFRDQSFPNFNMRNLGDVGGYVALSTGFWDELLQVGMTFKPTIRFSLNEADQQITYSDVTTENANGDPILIDQFKNIWQDRQFAIPVDFGIKSDLEFGFLKDSFFLEQLKPQVGITWQDVGSPSFAPSPSSRQTLNAGMSINPQLWRLKSLFALELREINLDRPFLSKLHLGTEVKLPWILAVRAGLSQGYYTAGLTLDFRFVQIDGAIYSEEVGFNTREAGSLRYATTLGFKI